MGSDQLGVSGDDLVCSAHLNLTQPEKEIVADRALRAFVAEFSYLSVREEIESIESLFSLGDRETAAALVGKLLKDLGRIPVDQRGQLGVLTLTRVGVALSPEQRDAVAKSVWGTSYYGDVAPIRVLQEDLFAKTPDELKRILQSDMKQAESGRFYSPEFAHFEGFLLARLIHVGENAAARDGFYHFWNAWSNTHNPQLSTRVASPVIAALAETGHVPEALAFNQRALAAANGIDSEDQISKALADIAINFARCHHLVEANEAASRCTRSMDQLRAYTAVVAAGSGLPVPDPEMWRFDPARNFNPTCCR
jgi:hypothetical protein